MEQIDVVSPNRLLPHRAELQCHQIVLQAYLPPAILYLHQHKSPRQTAEDNPVAHPQDTRASDKNRQAGA